MNFKMYHENSCRIKDRKILIDYLLGGTGIVTLKSPSGIHHTYMFRKPRNPNEFPEDIYFVYAISRDNKLFYVGMLENMRFRLTMNSRFRADNDIAKGAKYIERLMNSPKLFENTKMEIYHEGVCSVCGRKLTNPKSIKYGIGPECRRKLYATK